jgi:FKBP-type peptidyl-prolyl cis-trans isomerase FkpA
MDRQVEIRNGGGLSFWLQYIWGMKQWFACANVVQGTIFPLFVAICLVLAGCKKFDPEEQAELDQEIISQYVADHSLTALSSGTGLHWVIDSIGTGDFPTINSEVTVDYRGYLTNGTVFDESGPAGLTFPLNSVIAGWQEGIPKFRAGGEGMLLIPSALGYGNQEVGSIPENSVLVFDIRLLDVQ